MGQVAQPFIKTEKLQGTEKPIRFCLAMEECDTLRYPALLVFSVKFKNYQAQM